MTLEKQQYNNMVLTASEEKTLNQKLIQPEMIEDIQQGLPDRKIFLKLFEDWEMLQIYLMITSKPHSRKGVGRKLGIPTTTVFRKMNWLHENGLIKFTGKKGEVRAEDMFKACYTKIKMEFGMNFELLHATESKEIKR